MQCCQFYCVKVHFFGYVMPIFHVYSGTNQKRARVCVCVNLPVMFGDAIDSSRVDQGQSNHETATAKLKSIRAAAPVSDEHSLCGEDDDGTSVPLIVARKFRANSPSSKVDGPALGC
mmetsp:Transcript_25715/g.60898  ORF Transcript_25715/g.60898 Transcript_25715/m.60898 type:complete len:117 (+) Transcript_25715:682-1032(+)